MSTGAAYTLTSFLLLITGCDIFIDYGAGNRDGGDTGSDQVEGPERPAFTGSCSGFSLTMTDGTTLAVCDEVFAEEAGDEAFYRQGCDNVDGTWFSERCPEAFGVGVCIVNFQDVDRFYYVLSEEDILSARVMCDGFDGIWVEGEEIPEA